MTDDRLIPGDDAQAAELALGVLEGPERAAAQRRVLAEPPFAREVEGWVARFAALFELWPEVEPPATGWLRLERAIAPVRRPAARVWQLAAAAMAVLAAVLGLQLLQRPTPVNHRGHAPQMVAALLPTTTGKPVTAVYDPDGGSVTLSQVPDAGNGHAAELWVIAGGKPRSLGVITAGARQSVSLPAAERAALTEGVQLAISIEPAGGSPTGLPTGPVVAAGVMVQI